MLNVPTALIYILVAGEVIGVYIGLQNIRQLEKLTTVQSEKFKRDLIKGTLHPDNLCGKL